MLSYQDAKAKAIDSGIPADKVTPQDIVLFGWDPNDTFANSYAQQSAAPTMTDDQVHAELMALHEEAVANGVGAQALGFLMQAIKLGVGAIKG